MTTDDRGDPKGISESKERELPPGYPERPDMKKVKKLRKQLAVDRYRGQKREWQENAFLLKKSGKHVRDIGSYTMIPMMMVAGPLIGFGFGYLVQLRWGWEPWPGVVGLLFGLVAAFRQIFLMLAKGSSKNNN